VLDAGDDPSDDAAPTMRRRRSVTAHGGTVDQTPNEPTGAPGPESGPAPEPDPTPEADPKPTDSPRSGRSVILEVAQTLLLTLVIFVVIQNLVAQPFKVEGQSMELTFVEGDYVLVDRLTPRWSPYVRGQVVVLTAPVSWSEGGAPFIKRVIGIGGDTVEVRADGTVAVNGSVLDEPYLYRDETGATEPTFADEEATWGVPDGEVFVMGDHRQASMDSRVFGPVAVSTLIGRGVVRYWPLSDIGFVATPVYENTPTP